MDLQLAASACVILGFALVLVEIFLIPGVGVVGLFGATLICVGGGLVWMEHGMAAGLGVLGGSAFVALLLVWGFWSSGAAQRFVLQDRLDGPPQTAPADLLGRRGEAVTSLRPAGQAVFVGERYDVVTDGDFVEAGRAITVLHVEGFRVVVEAAPEVEEETPG